MFIYLYGMSSPTKAWFLRISHITAMGFMWETQCQKPISGRLGWFYRFTTLIGDV